MPPAAGRSFGPYDLVRRLGEGGMGVVYEALDRRLGRVVALKMLLQKERKISDVTLKRFEREARAAGKLRHPNVCSIHETGTIEGMPYFTMDLVRGDSLSGLIQKAQGPLPWRQAAAVVRDAARGLAHAHDQAIVHRDLKPSNILVDEEGRGHLVDFGLAREAGDERERLTRTGVIVGTPLYLAPENLDGGKTEAAAPSDIYALGATLYEALSGDPPFKKDSVYALFDAIQRGNPEPPTLPPGTPGDLARVALRALAREPSRRYLTAAAMADDLDRVLGGSAIVGRRSTVNEIARAHRRALGSLVLLALVGLLVLVVARRAPSVPPREAPVPPPVAPPPPVHVDEPAHPAPFVVTASTPEGAIDQGRARLWAGDLEAARACYRKALHLAPTQLDALLEEALVGVLLDDPSATVAANDAIVKHSQHPVASVLLETFSAEEFHFDIGVGKPSFEALKASPLSPLLRAIHLRKKDESEPDTVILRSALKERPRCGLLAIELARALRRAGKPGEALTVLGDDRSYEGVAASMREWARAEAFEAQNRRDAADESLARIAGPPNLLVRARGKRAAHAIARGDLAAAVALFQKSEPGSIEDRLALVRALVGLGRTAEGRKVLDLAIEIAEHGGDRVGIVRAAGGSPSDVKSALAESDGIALTKQASARVLAAHGLRARMAARAGDLATARAELELLAEESPERVATQGTIALETGDLPTAVRELSRAATLKDPVGADALLDCGRALEKSGDRRGALAAWKLAAQSDPTAKARADAEVARLGTVPLEPSTEEVLLDETPDDLCMIGGRDGKGRWLLTNSDAFPKQDTIHGYAPVVLVPLRAMGRKVVFETETDDQSVGLEILRGIVPLTEHGWWNTGHGAVISTRSTLAHRVVWAAVPGTYTFLVARFQPPGTQAAAVTIRRVRVTLER